MVFCILWYILEHSSIYLFLLSFDARLIGMFCGACDSDRIKQFQQVVCFRFNNLILIHQFHACIDSICFHNLDGLN